MVKLQYSSSAWPSNSHNYTCTVPLCCTVKGTRYTFTRICVHVISNSAKHTEINTFCDQQTSYSLSCWCTCPEHPHRATPTKVVMWGGIPDVAIYSKFRRNHLRSFGSMRGQILPFSLLAHTSAEVHCSVGSSRNNCWKHQSRSYHICETGLQQLNTVHI